MERIQGDPVDGFTDAGIRLNIDHRINAI